MPAKKQNKSVLRKSDANRPVSNADAFERLVSFLEETGCVETVDLALIQGCRTLAALMDDEPTGVIAREYFAALRELRGITNNDQDGFNDLVEQLRAAPSDPEV